MSRLWKFAIRIIEHIEKLHTNIQHNTFLPFEKDSSNSNQDRFSEMKNSPTNFGYIPISQDGAKNARDKVVTSLQLSPNLPTTDIVNNNRKIMGFVFVGCEYRNPYKQHICTHRERLHPTMNPDSLYEMKQTPTNFDPISISQDSTNNKGNNHRKSSQSSQNLSTADRINDIISISKPHSCHVCSYGTSHRQDSI